MSYITLVQLNIFTFIYLIHIRTFLCSVQTCWNTLLQLYWFGKQKLCKISPIDRWNGKTHPAIWMRVGWKSKLGYWIFFSKNKFSTAKETEAFLSSVHVFACSQRKDTITGVGLTHGKHHTKIKSNSTLEGSIC